MKRKYVEISSDASDEEWAKLLADVERAEIEYHEERERLKAEGKPVPPLSAQQPKPTNFAEAFASYFGQVFEGED